MPSDLQIAADEAGDSPGWFFDNLVLGLAAWTVAANVVVFLGETLRVLSWVVLFLVPSALYGAARLRASSAARSFSGARKEAGAEDRCPPTALERSLVLVVAALAAGLSAQRLEWLGAWAIGLPLAALLVLREWGSSCGRPTGFRAAGGRLERRLLMIIAAVCCVLTSVANRADSDDAFYVNIAVAVADHPDAPMLAADTMHGIEGVALPLALYRLQSYELLAGLCAWLTPLRALDWIHIVLPALVALMIPFGLARLLRPLVPRAWIWAVLFAVLAMWSVGDPHRSFGNFGFVRLQQGKAVLVSFLLPLVLHYGVLFARRPDRYRWLLLAGVQIVALGMSITSLWLAPICAGLGLLMGFGFERSASAVRPGRRALVTLGAGFLASFYPVGAALLLRASTLRDFEIILEDVPIPSPVPILPLCALLALFVVGFACATKGGEFARRAWLSALLGVLLFSLYLVLGLGGDPGVLLDRLGAPSVGRGAVAEGAEYVLGRGGFGSFLFFLLLGGWALARGALLRRFFALHGLVLLGIFWNPMTAEALAAGVVGQPTYWRVFWLLPAACMLGAALATTIESPPRGNRPLGIGIACLGAALLLWGLPAHTALSASNGVRFGKPGWKIPEAELEASSVLVEYAHAGSRVLAPFPVSEWIPAFHQHPSPLIVRLYYKRMLLDVLPHKEFRRRVKLTRMVSQPAITEFQAPEETRNDFRTAIDDFALEALCISRAAFVGAVRPALQASPLQQVFENEKYLVWARP